MNEEKQGLYNICAEQLELKIKSVHDAIKLQKESSAGDTKSSAGDKYETGTAMAHLELQKLGNQLSQLENGLLKLNSFTHYKPTDSVKAGSLVKTKTSTFWISIGVGEVKFKSHKYFVVSAMSPIAQKFLGKKVGYSFIFNRMQDEILEIS